MIQRILKTRTISLLADGYLILSEGTSDFILNPKSEKWIDPKSNLEYRGLDDLDKFMIEDILEESSKELSSIIDQAIKNIQIVRAEDLDKDDPQLRRIFDEIVKKHSR